MNPERNIPGVTPVLKRRLRRAFRLLSRVNTRLAGKLAFHLFLTPPRRKLDAGDLPTVARAQRLAVTAEGHEIRIYVWGEPSRPGVALLHGWGSHSPRFSAFVDPLLAAGFRVIGIDAPAHGESSGRQSNLQLFRVALAQVMRDHGPVTGAIAHSMGAAAVLWQLAELPHPDMRAVALVGMPEDVAYMMGSFVEMLQLEPAVAADLRRRFRQRFGLEPEAFSTHAIAGKIAVPVLVVHDRDDDVAPFDHADRLLPRLARGELLATQGLSHSGALRDRPSVDSIIAFLVRHA